jgi:anthranilate phosphoribosyltransferase
MAMAQRHKTMWCCVNAAIAIRTIKPEASFADCFYEAEGALLNKKALFSFEKLINRN